MPILLYEQFVHLTKIPSRPRIQFLSTQQRANQSFLVTSWLDSVYITSVSLNILLPNMIQQWGCVTSSHNIITAVDTLGEL